MSESKQCPECRKFLPADALAGLCPECLLRMGMETDSQTAVTADVLPAATAAHDDASPKVVPSESSLAIGEEFGHFTLVRRLGSGGMGDAYEAVDKENGRRVALKVLKHSLQTPEARKRFLREGRSAASINHPNSVYVYGTEEIDGTPVISMELVSGDTLEGTVCKRGPLPIREAVDVILEVIAGLEAAEQAGVLHRDIKPANCFVDSDGVIKVGDFGLSISTMGREDTQIRRG